jgi:hypothetical protein
MTTVLLLQVLSYVSRLSTPLTIIDGYYETNYDMIDEE